MAEHKITIDTWLQDLVTETARRIAAERVPDEAFPLILGSPPNGYSETFDFYWDTRDGERHWVEVTLADVLDRLLHPVSP